MIDYSVYQCPKCQINKQIPLTEKFDCVCKACGGKMKYLGTVRANDHIKREEEFYKQKYLESLREQTTQRDIIRCPKCGSTAVTTGARGINWFWGTIGSGKTVNRCGNCGYTWKPNGR